MQMRLAFAVAIHSAPEVLLVDEMLAVGDLAFQQKSSPRLGSFGNGAEASLWSHTISL